MHGLLAAVPGGPMSVRVRVRAVLALGLAAVACGGEPPTAPITTLPRPLTAVESQLIADRKSVV